MPPDVRQGFASPVLSETKQGCALGTASGPRAKPERGAQPLYFIPNSGEAQPRLTSGGKADAIRFDTFPAI